MQNRDVWYLFQYIKGKVSPEREGPMYLSFQSCSSSCDGLISHLLQLYCPDSPEVCILLGWEDDLLVRGQWNVPMLQCRLVLDIDVVLTVSVKVLTVHFFLCDVGLCLCSLSCSSSASCYFFFLTFPLFLFLLPLLLFSSCIHSIIVI